MSENSGGEFAGSATGETETCERRATTKTFVQTAAPTGFALAGLIRTTNRKRADCTVLSCKMRVLHDG